MGKIENILEHIGATKSDFEYNQEHIKKTYQQEKNNDSSLILKILAFLGGNLATSFFITFLFFTGIYSSKAGLIVMGSLFLAMSVLINKIVKHAVIDTFTISVYLAGLTLLLLGFDLLKIDNNTIAIIAILIALGTLFVVPNYILSFTAILLFCSGVFALIIWNFAHFEFLYVAINTLILSLLFLKEAHFLASNNRLSALYSPIKTGLLIWILIITVLLNIPDFWLFAIPKTQEQTANGLTIELFSTAILSFISIYSAQYILNIYQLKTKQNLLWFYISIPFILIFNWYLPNVSIAIIITFLSFIVRFKSGIVLGVISIIGFISKYYYDLEISLLNKSIILMLSGAVFIGAYVILHVIKLRRKN